MLKLKMNARKSLKRSISLSNQDDNVDVKFSIIETDVQFDPLFVKVEIPELTELPDCWSQNQCDYFKSMNPWLIVKNKRLGCQTCIKVIDNQARKPSSWQKCEVTHAGRTLETQQSSLRKKIFEHKASDYHKKATEREVVEERKQEEALALDQEYIDQTKKVFRTVYKIVTNYRPFEELEDEIDFQISNGLVVDRVPYNKICCAEITNHIARQMRLKLVAEMVQNKRKISILLHEIFNYTVNSMLLVCIQVNFNDECNDLFAAYGDVINFDLLDIDGKNDVEIANLLINCLKENNFTNQYIQECLLSCTCNEISILCGKQIEIAKSFHHLFPNLVWHSTRNERPTYCGPIIKKIEQIAINLPLIHKKDLSSVTFINCMGLPLKKFNPDDYVKTWLFKDKQNISGTKEEENPEYSAIWRLL